MSETSAPVVVLDVDRTLIAGTSWFHVLSDPLGPLGEAERVAFVADNDETYGPGPTMDESRFRARTLELLGRSGTTPHGLRRAGRDTVYLLPAYVEPMAYLRLLVHREPETEVVFLSSGYADFIGGVVEGVLRAYQLGPLRYRVVASELSWREDGPVERRHLDGAGKAEAVRALLDEGRVVRLIADDQYHDEELFSLVEVDGGAAVRVVHDRAASRSRTSRSWRDQLRIVAPAAADLSAVMDSADRFGLDRTHRLLSRYRSWFANLPYSSTPIGVGEMLTDEYDTAVASLQEMLPEHLAPMLRDRLDALTHDAGRTRLLRGTHFYIATPPYLFADPRARLRRWRDGVDVAREALDMLDLIGVRSPRGWSRLRSEERWIVLTVLDHLRSAVLHGVDAVVRLGSDCSDADALAIEDLQRVTDLAFWSLVTEQPQVVELGEHEGWEIATEALGPSTSWRVRELDDPFVCLLAAVSMREQLADRAIVPTCVVDFASGALDLGGALMAVSPPGLPDWTHTELCHVAYSSKGRSRRGSAQPGRTEIFAGMHPVHRARLDRALELKGTVLLVDNNVATFATLARTKALLASMTPGRVEAAVACIFLENIVDAHSGRPHEPLVEGWRDVLDLRPVAGYVPAFATWGTGCKTVELDRLYCAPATAPELVPARDGDGVVLKICRVHNLLDASVSLGAGATWFGIHAVSPLGEVYEHQSARYHPLAAVSSDRPALPLPWHEVEGMRRMLARLDGSVEVVLVVEAAHPAPVIRAVLNELGLTRPVRLQLQCRIEPAYLASVRPFVSGFVCAVGSDQYDAGQYVDGLASVLDAHDDLFLLDHSSHQPDFITPSPPIDVGRNRRNVVPALAASGIGVLVADDCAPANLLERAWDLHRQGVRVLGVDTQNAVEADKREQRFRMLTDNDGPAHTLIRKSADRMNLWHNLVPEMERLWGYNASLHW